MSRASRPRIASPPTRSRLQLTVAVLAASLLPIFPGTGWSHTGTAPVSFSASVPALSPADAEIMPAVDDQQYLREDAERIASGVPGPLRFAAPIAVELSATGNGVWSPVEGGRIWRCEVLSPGARSLNFGLTAFRLPDGATLHLYPSDRSTFDGPFTRADATPEGELWTPVIAGDDVVLEMFVPTGAAFEPELVVTQVGHDYRGFGQHNAEPLQGSCNNDVVCPVGDPWRAEIRSEGVYTLSGSWTCSGQLVNTNVSSNPPPYFETAYHCGISSSNAGSMVVYWKFESPHCGDLCCGSLSWHQTGATFKAKWSTSDFCLVQLNQTPSTDFNVYYAGWDAREENAPQAGIGIHHPNCDEKAISFNNNPESITSYLGTSVPGDGTHWRIDQWEDGTTEPGSSGSGLWDQNHHLIGQLHGGWASCTSLTSDYYGRLSRSWNGGGTSANRLKDWLDPSNTGNLINNGYDPFNNTAVQSPAPFRDGLRTVEPNPARGPFRVAFALPKASVVGIDLFDASGRAVSSQQARAYPAGDSQVRIDAAAADGTALHPGIYFVRLTVNGRAEGTRKLVVVE